MVHTVAVSVVHVPAAAALLARAIAVAALVAIVRGPESPVPVAARD
jgi:hypothetical protein